MDGWRSKRSVPIIAPFEFLAHLVYFCHRLYSNLKANREWMDDLHAADAILVATHSQGSVVSTHLLDTLIRDKHIRTSRNTFIPGATESFPTADLNHAPALPIQRVCCLALCGIHLGPLRYLSSSSLLQPYIQVRIFSRDTNCLEVDTSVLFSISILSRWPRGNFSNSRYLPFCFPVETLVLIFFRLEHGK